MAKTYKLRDVEAEQLTFDQEKDAPENDDAKDERTNATELADWCNGREAWVPNNHGVLVPQVVFEDRSGTRVVNVDDWLVKLNDNEFDVMTDRNFRGKYNAGK